MERTPRIVPGDLFSRLTRLFLCNTSDCSVKGALCEIDRAPALNSPPTYRVPIPHSACCRTCGRLCERHRIRRLELFSSSIDTEGPRRKCANGLEDQLHPAPITYTKMPEWGHRDPPLFVSQWNESLDPMAFPHQVEQ